MVERRIDWEETETPKTQHMEEGVIGYTVKEKKDEREEKTSCSELHSLMPKRMRRTSATKE